MLTPFFTAKLGGPYDVINELAFHLGKKGVNTSIYTSSSLSQQGKQRTEFFEKKSEYFSINRFNTQFKFREYRISLKLIPFLLKNAENIDIIHSHALRSYQEDIGSLTAFIKKKPLLINPHGGISINWDYSDKIPKMLYDKLIAYFKHRLIKPHFIAVAKSEIPIIENYGIDRSRIHYIPHGVNTEIFKPVDSSDLKRNLNLENFEVILYVGRIAKGKGVDKLIKILNLIVKKNKKVKLVIVGGDSGALPIVKSLILKYNLSKHVIFTGFISKNNLSKYYSLADLVVYPSRQEIFGLVITEAGACGKPTIGSDILGPSEIIINGKTGYISNFKNLNEVSDLILSLLDNKSHLVQMGKNAFKNVKENYTWEKAADSYKAVYEKLLNK